MLQYARAGSVGQHAAEAVVMSRTQRRHLHASLQRAPRMATDATSAHCAIALLAAPAALISGATSTRAFSTAPHAATTAATADSTATRAQRPSSAPHSGGLPTIVVRARPRHGRAAAPSSPQSAATTNAAALADSLPEDGVTRELLQSAPFLSLPSNPFAALNPSHPQERFNDPASRPAMVSPDDMVDRQRAKVASVLRRNNHNRHIKHKEHIQLRVQRAAKESRGGLDAAAGVAADGTAALAVAAPPSSGGFLSSDRTVAYGDVNEPVQKLSRLYNEGRKLFKLGQEISFTKETLLLKTEYKTKREEGSKVSSNTHTSGVQPKQRHTCQVHFDFACPCLAFVCSLCS